LARLLVYGWKWNRYQADWNQYFANSLNGGTSYDLRVSPFYFLYGGRVDTGSLIYAKSVGYYWAATAFSVFQAYYMVFNGRNTYPATNDNYFVGNSIRCLTR